MRRVDPGLPVPNEEVPEWGKRLIAAIYELENKRPRTPTFTINDGTVDRAVYDYLKFGDATVSGIGVDGVSVAVTEEGTWTPFDSSGASLTFTAAGGSYTKIGRLVVAQCVVQYPATASGANAFIGGLPYTISAVANAAGAAYTTCATATIPVGIANTTVIALVAAAGAAAITNAQMTGKVIAFTLSYEV